MTVAPARPETPTLDRMQAPHAGGWTRRDGEECRLVDHSQLLGEFVDWLEAQGIHLAKWGRHYEVPVDYDTLRVRLRREMRPDDELDLGLSRMTWRDTVIRRFTNRKLMRAAREAGHADADSRFFGPKVSVPSELFATVHHWEARVEDDVLEAHHEMRERLLARYFDIDLDKAEDEKRALLDWVRAQA